MCTTLFEIDFKALRISRSSALNRIYGFLNSENTEMLYIIIRKTSGKTREKRGRRARERGNDERDERVNVGAGV